MYPPHNSCHASTTSTGATTRAETENEDSKRPPENPPFRRTLLEVRIIVPHKVAESMDTTPKTNEEKNSELSAFSIAPQISHNDGSIDGTNLKPLLPSPYRRYTFFKPSPRVYTPLKPYQFDDRFAATCPWSPSDLRDISKALQGRSALPVWRLADYVMEMFGPNSKALPQIGEPWAESREQAVKIAELARQSGYIFEARLADTVAQGLMSEVLAGAHGKFVIEILKIWRATKQQCFLERQEYVMDVQAQNIMDQLVPTFEGQLSILESVWETFGVEYSTGAFFADDEIRSPLKALGIVMDTICDKYSLDDPNRRRVFEVDSNLFLAFLKMAHIIADMHIKYPLAFEALNEDATLYSSMHPAIMDHLSTLLSGWEIEQRLSKTNELKYTDAGEEGKLICFLGGQPKEQQGPTPRFAEEYRGYIEDLVNKFEGSDMFQSIDAQILRILERPLSQDLRRIQHKVLMLYYDED